MSADNKWTPLNLVKTTTDYLAGKSVPSPRLDAELLLADILGCRRIELYTQFERPLTEEELDAYRELVRRRAAREPVNRILGKCEFMGLEFKVTSDVLSPRSDTEILVEEALRLLGANVFGVKKTLPLEASEEEVEAEADEGKSEERPAECNDIARQNEDVQTDVLSFRHVLDLGTGSGCIAISLVSMCPKCEVVATDISAAALLVARENAQNIDVWEKVHFREGNLFEPCMEGEQFDMILSNPPYLVDGDPEIWPEVSGYDPALALYGGEDGLDFYRYILAQAETFLLPGGRILLEVGAGQAKDVIDMINSHTLLEGARTLKDHSGIDRVVVADKPQL